MNFTNFIEPFNDENMIYDTTNRRYILTPEYVANRGIDLSLILETEHLLNPADAPRLLLERVSYLVYAYIYSKGRTRPQKEYLLACNPQLRPIIMEAMFERLNYMIMSGDLSIKSGAIIQDGVKIDIRDLVPSFVEQDLLYGSGIMHRGAWQFIKNEKLNY